MSQPNYITEYRSFLKDARDRSLGATPQLMYLHMLDIANDAEWPGELSISNVELGNRLRCSDESILRARRALVKMGRIQYLGQRNRKPYYHMHYYTQAVENPVDNLETGRPWPPGEKAVEPPVEQAVEPSVKQSGENGKNTGVDRGVEHPVEQGVEHPVEKAVEAPVEAGVERPVENPVEPSQTETPNETPKSSSSSSSARDARMRLRARLSALLYPPGPAEEGLVDGWARDFDPAVVEDMLALALKRGARTYRYLEVGMNRLRAKGITTLAAYRANEEAFARSQGRSGCGSQGRSEASGGRVVKEVAQHRYSGQRGYSDGQWEALVTDPFGQEEPCEGGAEHAG